MGTHRNPAAPREPNDDAWRFYREHGYWRQPLLVQWMATGQCSMGCEHCLSGAEAGAAVAADELDLAEVAELLDQLVAMGRPELLITGGEPLERPDMAQIIELLAERRIGYSLNTAVYPDRACQEAMRRWPPSFVAVSLDGPESYHDAFRKKVGSFAACSRAIALYRDITGGAVAAGTTITRSSLEWLDDTFRLVVESGAASWGLHLVVPEGRAAERPDLQLTTAEAKRLLEFAASRRRFFPINLADEIGYCGQWEPLVRDTPFYCGAGRAQCVVLPGGDVVPCTTTDRAASAGNLRERALADIWHHGFAELRRGDHDTRCTSCRYLAVCQGGCWLQRRRSQHCFRDVWDESRAPLGKAGLAVCFGLAACGGPLPSAGDQPSASNGAPPPAVTVAPAVPVPAPAEPTDAPDPAAPSAELDAAVLQCLVAKLRDNGASPGNVQQLSKLLGGDPAWPVIAGLLQEKRPSELQARADRVRAAMASRQRSLFVASLLWRDLAEWCLDCKPPRARTASERALLRDTLAGLQAATQRWRRHIYANQLDPFLFRNNPRAPHFMLSKALRPPPPAHGASLKHWGTVMSARHHPLSRAFLDAHPFAFNQRLAVTTTAAGLVALSGGKATPVAGTAMVDVFDVLITPASQVPLQASVARVMLQRSRATGKPPREVRGSELPVVLPPAADLTYVDVLRLAYEQNRDTLRPGRYSSPFDIAAHREKLAELLAQGGAAAEIDQQRWRLLQAWLF